MEGIQHGVDRDATLRLLHGKVRGAAFVLEPYEKGALMSVLGGSLMTQNKYSHSGPAISDLCPLCGECREDEEHT